jgi:hypothetical protein
MFKKSGPRTDPCGTPESCLKKVRCETIQVYIYINTGHVSMIEGVTADYQRNQRNRVFLTNQMHSKSPYKPRLPAAVRLEHH